MNLKAYNRYSSNIHLNESGNQSGNKDQKIKNDIDNKVTNNNKSKGLNGNQHLNNIYGNIDSTEVNNNHLNPSSNIIRVYTQQTNNDNTTNTNKISNNYNSQNRSILERTNHSKDTFHIETVT